MISLLPAENAAWAEGVAQDAHRAAQENFAGFARVGDLQIPTYNNMFVIPEEQHPVSERSIRLEDVRAILAPNWPEAERVESGYSSHVEATSGTFAFGAAYGSAGGFYGSLEGDTVARLYITRPTSDDPRDLDQFEEALAHLAERYNLVLADWWTKAVLDLHNREAIKRYLVGDS